MSNGQNQMVGAVTSDERSLRFRMRETDTLRLERVERDLNDKYLIIWYILIKKVRGWQAINIVNTTILRGTTKVYTSTSTI